MISRFVGLAKLFAISPEKGADTIVYLASAPDVATTSGGYFYQRKPGTLSKEALDNSAGRRLLGGRRGDRRPLAALGIPTGRLCSQHRGGGRVAVLAESSHSGSRRNIAEQPSGEGRRAVRGQTEGLFAA